MFQFTGFPPIHYGFMYGWPYLYGRVSPFRYLRILGYLLLPEAFRSLSRLSSALSAKASSLCSSSLNQFRMIPLFNGWFHTGRIALRPWSGLNNSCVTVIDRLSLFCMHLSMHHLWCLVKEYIDLVMQFSMCVLPFYRQVKLKNCFSALLAGKLFY